MTSWGYNSCSGGNGFKLYQNSDGSGYCVQFFGSGTVNNLNSMLWPGCSFLCNIYPRAWSSQGESGSFSAGISCAAVNNSIQSASLGPGRGVTALPSYCSNQVFYFNFSNA